MNVWQSTWPDRFVPDVSSKFCPNWSAFMVRLVTCVRTTVPEFVSRAILKWAAQNGMDMALSDPGKPWQNGADESFNGKFRDECLSLEWFRTRTEAKVVIEQWRRPLQCHPTAFESGLPDARRVQAAVLFN